MKTAILLVCTLALASIVNAAPPATSQTPPAAGPPAVPATPAAVDGIVYARSFTLEEGYKFDWRKERPLITTGTILVLKVNPDLVYPRQLAEPVLYVGNQTAERVNSGFKSGRVVAIVPGEIDLQKTPIWFGTPELPERVDADAIQKERAKADKAGIKPFDKAEIKAALKNGGEKLSAANQDQLRRGLAPLIRQYSPKESILADTLAAIPEAKPRPAPEEKSD